MCDVCIEVFFLVKFFRVITSHACLAGIATSAVFFYSSDSKVFWTITTITVFFLPASLGFQTWNRICSNDIWQPNSHQALLYGSGSQPVCRDTQVCRVILSSVPPNYYLIKHLKIVLFLPFLNPRCAAKFISP
jgi:hypothetical protein